MFLITYILNGEKEDLCVLCDNIEEGIELIDNEAKIIGWEKLY